MTVQRFKLGVRVGSLAIAALLSAITAAQAGVVWAWGLNDQGQLGNGTNSTTPNATLSAAPADSIMIAGGRYHSLALREDGTVWAWGSNEYGQLGDSSKTDRWEPVAVAGLANVVEIGAGERHSIARLANGTVWTWGNNQYGQLGDDTWNERLIPVQVANLTNVVSVSAGGVHNLAVKLDGSVWAWGDGNWGKLGDGASFDRKAPVQVQGPTSGFLSGIVAVAAGDVHSLAIDTSGNLWGWGANAAGQLGDGTTYYERLRPVKALAISNADQVSARSERSIARTRDGRAWAWGVGASVPAPIGALSEIVALSAGSNHSLFLRYDGTVWAVGVNDKGQLGDGTYDTRTTPVQTTGATDAILIAAGGRHSMCVSWDKRPFRVWVESFAVAGGVKTKGFVRFPESADSARNVRLTDDSDKVLMSTYCIVPPGETLGAFDIWTYGVSMATTTTITARFGGVTHSSQLTLLPASLDILWLNPTAVVGGNPSMGNIRLVGKAPFGGAVVSLATTHPAAANHAASVTISWGASLRQFPVSTFGVDSTQNVTISASYAGLTRTAIIRVFPATLSTLNLASNSVTGGTPVSATVVMTGKVGPLGRTVLLSSNHQSIIVPGSMYVPPQKFSWNFTVLTQAVTSSTTGTITASQGTTTRTATLTLMP